MNKGDSMDNKARKLLENDKFAAFIGIKLIEMKPGYAKAKMKINESHLNGVEIVQGGAIFTLADFAFAAASNAHGIITVATNGNISFLKASSGDELIAEAKEISSSKKIVHYHVDIYDNKKERIAQFNGTGYRMGHNNEK